MFKILFIGDICGKLGREAVKKLLPGLKKEYHPDFIIANAENSSHGKGVTESTLNELAETGIHFFTTGDHAFDATKTEEFYSVHENLIRPANFPDTVPGVGYKLISVGKYNILVINLIGRVFMHMDYDCPFVKTNNILANFTKQKISAILVDIHAEATSEKVSILHHLDGRVSAVIGTHTHVMTADSRVTDKGTAFITDAGMTGYSDGVIGVDKDNIIKTFLTQVKYQHQLPESGRAILNAVLISVNTKTGQAEKIKPISKLINIK